MAKYTLDNAWERAKRRLTLLEQHLDPMTQRRLVMLGLGLGWNVLEVGGGGGSIAQWLCGRVGTDGHVMATDIDIRFLQKISEKNFEAVSHDITTEDLPAGKFHLVHTCYLAPPAAAGASYRANDSSSSTRRMVVVRGSGLLSSANLHVTALCRFRCSRHPPWRPRVVTACGLVPSPRWWLNEGSPTWVVKGTSLFSVADLRWRSSFG